MRCKDTKKNENNIVTSRQNVIFRAELPQSAAWTQDSHCPALAAVNHRNVSRMHDRKDESLPYKIRCTTPHRKQLQEAFSIHRSMNERSPTTNTHSSNDGCPFIGDEYSLLLLPYFRA
ncbi:MAG: hypothetical protein K2O17_06535 [Bacteroidaceae bacterium]|nr:hypothetical protein [Bacteroidaceae bacterium]